MKAAQAQFLASLGEEGEAEEVEEAAEAEELQCALCREAGGGSSPLCYITLGQVGRLGGIQWAVGSGDGDPDRRGTAPPPRYFSVP